MNTNKYVIAFIGAVVLLVAIIGGYQYPKSTTVVQSIGAVGDTNSTSKIASCVLDTSTTTMTTATTTGTGCLYNTDSKTRYITEVDYQFNNLGSMTGSNGLGVASTTLKLATSTNVYVPSINYVLNTTLATTTANGAISYAGVLSLFVASTTPGATATFPLRNWESGTYLDLLSNATSSATGMTGTIVVKYFLNN